jgi:hypothetical protein
MGGRRGVPAWPTRMTVTLVVVSESAWQTHAASSGCPGGPAGQRAPTGNCGEFQVSDYNCHRATVTVTAAGRVTGRAGQPECHVTMDWDHWIIMIPGDSLPVAWSS